jgi:hypothetical protein
MSNIFYGNTGNNIKNSNLTDYGTSSPFNSNGIISSEVLGPKYNNTQEDFDRVDIDVSKIDTNLKKTKGGKRKSRRSKRKSRRSKRKSKRR